MAFSTKGTRGPEVVDLSFEVQNLKSGNISTVSEINLRQEFVPNEVRPVVTGKAVASPATASRSVTRMMYR
jgi:hypothetical protein